MHKCQDQILRNDERSRVSNEAEQAEVAIHKYLTKILMN